MRIKFIIPVIAMFAMFTLFCCEDKLVSSEFAEAHDIPEFIEIEDSPLSAYEKNLDGVKNEIFDIVEEPASPIGGMAEFYKYVGETMKYPKKARKLGIEGRVFVQFIVDKTGQLKDVKSIKGIGAGCDDEAVRVIKAAANWTAGKQRGTPVNVRLILPITFKLTE